MSSALPPRGQAKGQAEHVEVNREHWDAIASDWVASGERGWRRTHPNWGIWGLPEDELDLLPSDMTGMRAIELGCGTGYISAWMARLGAGVVGIDNSMAQLRTARRLMQEHELEITWLHGNAEEVPRPDASFDFAISEYGAAIWCDPYVWIPEAHRLLKPGGSLTFLGNHPLVALTTPPSGANCDRQLHRPYFGMHRLDWRDVEVDPGGIEFNLRFSQWLELFRDTGFIVDDYLELRAPPDAKGIRYYVSAEWARNWPCEHVWKLRKSG